MTRKLITTLLCLVLAVALPLAALADTRHTLTLIPGDDLSAVPAIADLCDALSLTLTKGEKSGGLTLSVGGEDIATVALGADSTGLYVQSRCWGTTCTMSTGMTASPTSPIWSWKSPRQTAWKQTRAWPPR